MEEGVQRFDSVFALSLLGDEVCVPPIARVLTPRSPGRNASVREEGSHVNDVATCGRFGL